MKYLKSSNYFLNYYNAGNFNYFRFPLPVPAGVYGLFILLLLLCAGP